MGKLNLLVMSNYSTNWNTMSANGYISGTIKYVATGDVTRIETYGISSNTTAEGFIITQSLALELGWVKDFDNNSDFVILLLSESNNNKIFVSAFNDNHDFLIGGTIISSNVITVGSSKYYGNFVTSNAGDNPRGYLISPTYYGTYNQNKTNTISDLNSLISISPINEQFPITYRFTNCASSSAPNQAFVGDTVTVPLQFSSGYGIVNPSSDVYVTNNGVVVPSQYSNGVLTFTMPDPS